ncbi:hypothetical protein SAMN04487916_102223 [Arthrobacter sp. ov407]|nr:hypothetical protein SAMN04487916_102223 [Arthrobacter sp. ov407]
MPLAGGVRGTFRDGARVPPVRSGPGRGHQPPVAHPGELPGVGGEVLVDGGPVRRAQAGGFAHEQGGAPFVQLPGLQGGEGVRHFGHERLGQAQQPAALGRGFAPGQGDLRADPGTEPLRRDPCGGLLAALEQVERNGDPGLQGGFGGFQVLELAELVNHPGAVRGQRDSGQHSRHVRDYRPWIARARGRTAPGATEASVAVSCRNHFGPLIAVHSSSLPWGSDN